MRDHIAVTLTAIVLTACGSGGGSGADDALPSMPGNEAVTVSPTPASTDTNTNTTPANTSSTSTSAPAQQTTISSSSSSTPTISPYSFGAWSSYNPGHYRVEETSWTESSSQWAVHGTPSGSVDNLPQGSDGTRFEYSGPAWGRIYEGTTDHRSGVTADQNNGDRVYGTMTAYYDTRDRFADNDDYLTIFLTKMYKELPGGGIIGVPWMHFEGDVGTDKYAQGYDPTLDIATFTLKAQQYSTSVGREQGEAVGSFYGSNGEALAGTFWYRRSGNRIEGAFGGDR